MTAGAAAAAKAVPSRGHQMSGVGAALTTILSDLRVEAFVFQVEAINERARLHAVGRHP